MDESNVEKGFLSIQRDGDKEWIQDALRKYPGKFATGCPVNPIQNGIMNELR
jgi:hypothetical protein